MHHVCLAGPEPGCERRQNIYIFFKIHIPGGKKVDLSYSNDRSEKNDFVEKVLHFGFSKKIILSNLCREKKKKKDYGNVTSPSNHLHPFAAPPPPFLILGIPLECDRKGAFLG